MDPCNTPNQPATTLAPRSAEDSNASVPAAKLGGIVTALVTPLTPGQRLDGSGLENLIATQLSAGIDGIFVLGSVGEGPLLTDQVCDDVAACTVQCVAGRRPILAGASDNSVERCLGRLERLADLGVQFGVVTLPFYGWPGRISDSVDFFASVAARSPIPIVAYNLPKAVGWQMPVEALEALCAIPNLVCIKDTHGDFEKMAAIASSPKRPASVSYLPGNSRLAARLFRLGADGVVSTPANMFPEVYASLWRLAKAQQWEEVAKLDERLLGILAGLLDLMPTGASAIKGLLEIRGVCRRHTVRPWPEAGDADLISMRVALAKAESAIVDFEAVSVPK